MSDVAPITELPQANITSEEVEAMKGKDLLKRLAGKVSNTTSNTTAIIDNRQRANLKGWVLVYKNIAGYHVRHKNNKFLTSKGELLAKISCAEIFLKRRDAINTRRNAKLSYQSFLRIVPIDVTVSTRQRKPRKKKNEPT